MAIVEEYRDRITQVMSEKDHGVRDTMNKRLSMACGEYILFLNAGDELASPQILANIFK